MEELNPYRKLAAIMFTDMVGFSKLMGEDEKKALKLLTISHEIHQSQISRYGGSFIKEMGDGVLASFESASEAVCCAGAIQLAMDEIQVKFKIGQYRFT